MQPIAKLRPVVEPQASAPAGALVGECVDAQHPTLQGRARIRWTEPEGGVREQWLPMLMTVTVRALDRVLLLQPANFEEPVITGVLDGFATRPVREAVAGPLLTLQNDETVRVQSREGAPLLELSISESGPVVRLLSDAAALHLPGALSISAQSIALEARQGEVVVQATDDVLVMGATVRLN
jgi:hypothetical protein